MVNLKNMNRKEKIEYIWDYYKIHIISGIIIICSIGYFIYGQATRIEYVFNLTMVESTIKENKRIELEDKITNLVVAPEDKRKSAIVDVIPNSSDYQQIQKFYAKLAAKEIDILMLDKDMFSTLMKQDGFMQLDNISDIKLSNIKNNKVEAEVNGNKAVYGISAEGIKMFEENGVDTHNKVIAIVSSSTHRESAIKVFNWILSNQ